MEENIRLNIKQSGGIDKLENCTKRLLQIKEPHDFTSAVTQKKPWKGVNTQLYPLVSCFQRCFVLEAISQVLPCCFQFMTVKFYCLCLVKLEKFDIPQQNSGFTFHDRIIPIFYKLLITISSNSVTLFTMYTKQKLYIYAFYPLPQCIKLRLVLKYKLQAFLQFELLCNYLLFCFFKKNLTRYMFL